MLPVFAASLTFASDHGSVFHVKLLALLAASLLALVPTVELVRKSAALRRRLHRRRTMERLRAALPDARLVEETGVLFARSADGSRSIAIPTLRLDDAERRDALIEECNRAWHRTSLHGLSLLDAMSRVLPVPVSPHRVRVLGAHGLATRRVADDLVVAYVLDAPSSNLWLTRHDIEGWTLDPDQLHDAALTNLWDTTQGAIVLQEDVDGREIYQIRQGDGLDSSRLLLPGLWRQLADSCGGALVICAPTRDRIYAAPGHQPASIARLADHASGDWEALDAHVSPAFWVWENDALQRWGAHA